MTSCVVALCLFVFVITYVSLWAWDKRTCPKCGIQYVPDKYHPVGGDLCRDCAKRELKKLN